MTYSDVLIVGASPTGLALALWLAKFGVKFRIIDKATEPEPTSRALAVQARTLELYRQLDLADEVIRRSYTAPAVNLWLKGQKKTHVLLEEIRSHLTPFSFLQVFPQNEHERLLTERLKAIGIEVERGVELIDFSETDEKIVARLRGADGAEEQCETSYLAGCDGAHSTVRRIMGTNVSGGKRQHVFYVADLHGEGPAFNGELHVDLDEAHFLAIFPLAERGRGRLIGAMRGEAAMEGRQCSFDDVRERAVSHLKVEVKNIDWFATYRVRHQIAEQFRRGRAYLLGDAAHVHSPAGGQGLNAGIGDAVNLAWKLASVLKREAGEALLDTYEPERKAFARLAAFADRAFTLGTAEGALAGFVRTQVTPAVLPALAHVPTFREFMFRAASLVASNYRRSRLSKGKAGAVHGGDRLPWLGAAAAVDNYAPLSAACWQAHVYGAPREGLDDWCEEHNLPLHIFGWRKEYERAGLARDALYLMRPDTYVALAELEGGADAAERYFREKGIVVPFCEKAPPRNDPERMFVLKDFKSYKAKYQDHKGA
jgi:2-polyprenyl-6-methoxyphenol hydroxylase-like FAD-dependent oxidoreductase